MTKRISAVGLAVAAVLALGGTATAKMLPLPIAKGLATRLAQRQIHSRHIVVFHIRSGRRLAPERISFLYDDRSASNHYCTARILVTLRAPAGRIAIARFAGGRCTAIPADALAFESATLATSAAVYAQRPAVKAAAEAFESSYGPCASLVIPRALRASVRALVGAGLIATLESPVDPLVTKFTQTLGRIPTSDVTLRAAALAWADYVAGVHAIPRQATTSSALQP
ncbi:MAG: hypothetical protein NVS2B6_15280 [Thermoleophilaceae bacterium]